MWRLASPLEAARPARTKRRGDAEARANSSCVTVKVGRSSLRAPCSNVARAAPAALLRFFAAVQQRGGFGGEHFLGVVDLGALQRFQARDFIERQVGEDLEEAADVGVLGCCASIASNRRGSPCRR